MKSKLLGVLFVSVILSVNCVKAQNQIVEADLLSYNESSVVCEIDENEDKTTSEIPKENIKIVADKEESDENTSFPAVLACYISGNTTICRGQLTSLSIGGQKFLSGTTFLWSNGATTSTIIVSPTSNTNYSVTAIYGGATVCSASVTVTVNPLPNASISGADSICTGSSTTLTASGGGTYLWSTTATSASINVSPTSTTTYTVTVTSSLGCTKTAQKTVNVSPQSVGGTVTGGTTICSGSSCNLSLSGYTGQIIKWQMGYFSFQGGGVYVIIWDDIANTTGLTSYTTGTLSQRTAYRAVVQSGVCSVAYSVSDTVLVSPTTVGGSVTGGTTICSGSTSALLTLAGHTGTIVRWESSVSPFSTWTPITNTNTTYTSGALTQTTQFRALVKSGVCDSVFSTSTTVTVSPATVGGSVTGGTTICSGSTSGVLTLSGKTGSVVRWESSVSPFSTWTPITNTNTTYTSGALTATTQFRAVVQSSPCATVNSAVTTVTVSPTSVGGTVTGGTTICTGSTSGLLTLAGHTGAIVRWESSVSPFSTWTPITNTNTTYTSGTLTQTTQFRAVVQSTPCSTANSASTTVTVSALPNTSEAGTDQILCSITTTTLAGNTPTVGTGSWSVISGTATITTPTSPTSGVTGLVVGSSATLRWTISNSPCTESTDDVIISVRAIPNAYAGSNSPICSETTLNLTSSGGISYNWSGPNSFTSSLQNPIINNATVVASGTYTVTVTGTAGCTSTAETSVAVNALPTPTAGSNSPICAGDSLILNCTESVLYHWEGSNKFVNSSQNPIIQNSTMLNSGNYLVIVTDSNGCTNTAEVLVDIKPSPMITNIVDNFLCNGETIRLFANGADTCIWTGPQYTSTELINSIPNASVSHNGIYTVIVTNGYGCTASAVSTVRVAENPTVNAGIDVSICYNTETELTATGGVSYHWSNGATTSSTIVHPEISTTYSVETTNIDGCKATDEVLVTVNSPLRVYSLYSEKMSCSKGAMLKLSGSEIGVSYQLLINGANYGSPILGSGSVIDMGSVSANGTYTIKAKRNNDNCEQMMNESFVVN